MNWNQQLSEINEAIDTLKTTLDTFGDDPEMAAQLKERMVERDYIIGQLRNN